ncbi:hypothetical protein I3842_07G152700 [Carya illinoinensis]|uniref:Uncharacterized protein n=1 Tax=Carya illinoinensis TaxID=32201 RepID=A0A922JEM8_CARIL|nr:hypothetical protein I3842_07G152700 [Carya illinoinensis]
MGWFFRERRGPAWKHGWTEQTLASISLPPLPLVAIAGIIVLLLLLNSYATYRSQMWHTVITFKLFLFPLPVLLIFLMHSITKYGRIVITAPVTKNDTVHQAQSLPWGLALLVLVLVLMLSYQPYFHSMWWPQIRGFY